MKYLVALVIVVLLVRIDWILQQFDILSERWTTPTTPVIQDSEIKSSRETIPVTQDASFKQTPRQVFLALLEDFHNAPEKEVRVRAMEYFKSHPTLFTQKLDPELESTVFRWRDLLNNNEPEVASFLIDLLNILQGENQLMVRRFFALWMDINMEHFLAAYSRTKDTNCMIATTFGDNIPEEEKLNELREREDILKSIVAKEGLEPVRKTLATNCLLVLNLEIQKYPPLPAPEPEAPETQP